VTATIDPELLAALRERRAEADARLRRLDDDERMLLRDRADGTADDEHDPEGATLSGEWSTVDALRRATRTELVELDAALERAGRGTYGVCAVCGRPIPRERLLIRPMAERCVSCAR
jgi:RNA polymerase-binding transcription factor DksA